MANLYSPISETGVTSAAVPVMKHSEKPAIYSGMIGRSTTFSPRFAASSITVRRVIEQAKAETRQRLISLCEKAGLKEPDMLADELFLLLEGARVSAQSSGPQGPASRLVRMGEALIASHLA